MDDQNLDEIARQLQFLTEQAQMDLLLVSFARVIETMETETLRAFKTQCDDRNEGTTLENSMLEIIQGQLELRQVGVKRRSAMW